MDQRERQQLKAAFVTTALYYGATLQDEVLAMYVEDLADLPFPQLLEAMKAYRRSPKSRRPPLPADLRALVQGEASVEGRGREIAARLHGALVKYGYTWTDGYFAGGNRWFDGGGKAWPTWREAAVAELGGEDGAQVIDRLGGWAAFHQYANFAEPTVVAAQVRDLAATVGRVPKSAGPALPSSSRPALPGGIDKATLVSSLAEKLSAHAARDTET